jgi:biopolymer transport protein ExbD
MAAKRRFLDVWIIESNTVYKEVPFDVVADWVQQGRLLEDDMIKPSGTRDWFKLGASPDMAPYLPRAEPLRPNDEAEALEPVMLDFVYKRPRDEEDDDVDMIPLIDVSLVLLIFFMLTASAAVIASTVNNPEAANGLMADNPSSMRIDITLDGGAPVYSLALGAEQPAPEDRDLHTLAAVLDRLRVRLSRVTEPVELVINAEKDVKAATVRDVLSKIGGAPFRNKLKGNFFGVSERPQ